MRQMIARLRSKTSRAVADLTRRLITPVTFAGWVTRDAQRQLSFPGEWNDNEIRIVLQALKFDMSTTGNSRDFWTR